MTDSVVTGPTWPSVEQASRHTPDGAVAETEFRPQESQRFARQIEAIRSVVLAVGERQDVGPETYVHR